MLRKLLPSGAVLGALLAAGAAAQARPDFSGRWTSEPPPPAPPARDVAAAGGGPAPRPADFGSGWGRAVTITQDARLLTVEWPIFSAYDLQPPLRLVYALDGSETTNAVMMGRGVQRQRARAAWAGSSLVLTTVHALADPAAAGSRTVETEVRQTLTLESPTSLVVETVRGGAFGGPPSTSRTVYTRGGGP